MIVDREERIHRLEHLLARVQAELAAERASLRRALRARRDLPPAPAVAPAGLVPADVREWARENGWPDLGNTGRMRKDVLAAYVEAHA